MSSSSSHSLPSHSADASGYFTGRPRVNPLIIRENENRVSSESDQETSSAHDPYDGPRVLPTPVLRPIPIIIQPHQGGPRIRLTARKSVPIPRRVTLTSTRPEAPEPQRMAIGVPSRQASGPTWAIEQHVRAMATELHGCQVRITHQGQVISELVELTHQLTLISTQAQEGASMARRVAMRAESACLVVGMVLLLLVLSIVIRAYLG